MTTINLTAGNFLTPSIELISKIGEGGMGVVYKCNHHGLNRVIAVKLLELLRCSDSESVERFKREGKVLASFEQENIVKFYQFGVIKDCLPFIAMEFLEGVSLDRLMQEALPASKILLFLEQICKALELLHGQGIIHRDLKPANFMVVSTPEKDILKMLDFGLAGLIEPGVESQKLTKTGLLMGSLPYMSPEQCKGQKVDLRSDIYAVGCMIYQMLSGSTPFTVGEPLALLHAHVHQDTDPLNQEILNKGIEYQSLYSLAVKCMRKQPEERYQTISELMKDIEKIRSGEFVPQYFHIKRKEHASGMTGKLVLLAILIAAIVTCVAGRTYVEQRIAQIEGAYLKNGGIEEQYTWAHAEAERLRKRHNPAAAQALLTPLIPFSNKDKISSLFFSKVA